LQCPAALHRARALGYPVHDDIITGPDNYKFKILPSIAGRAEQFVCVCLRVNDLDKSVAYWSNLLGMRTVDVSLHSSLNSTGVALGFGTDEAFLQLVKVSAGSHFSLTAKTLRLHMQTTVTGNELCVIQRWMSCLISLLIGLQCEDGLPVDHALSSGRIAFACQSVSDIFSKV
jgi:hypothetical protein